MVETKLQPLPRERAPEALAKEAGTTTNDALLQLAYQRARLDSTHSAARSQRSPDDVGRACGQPGLVKPREAGEDGIVDEEALARAILGDRVDR
jgi:hypothetical protein